MKASKIILSMLVLVFASPIFADDHKLPKLELGVSLATLNIPNYRGSANSSAHVFVLPYVKYRGDQLKVDEGVQSIMFDSPSLVLSLSANGTLPVDGNNPERVGMPELDATLEIGPSLDYRISSTNSGEWWVELPLRLAFTLNSDMEHVGQVFQPRIVWRKSASKLYQWKLRASLGAVYASDEFHDYYYSVTTDQTLPDRPAYDADSGFSGIRGSFSYSRRYRQLWLGGFVRYDNLSQAVVEDSPLISDNSAWMAGLALGWIFYESY
ncbi:MAG: MipA/OmpV family protein [Gammaproteobacteria bacterium]|nr:MipA/OmpV family protein [Gammaproteobacteria bacterium]